MLRYPVHHDERRAGLRLVHLYTIDTAFKYNSFGMAATMAVAIMAIVILVYVFQNVVLKKVFNQEEAA